MMNTEVKSIIEALHFIPGDDPNSLSLAVVQDPSSNNLIIDKDIEKTCNVVLTLDENDKVVIVDKGVENHVDKKSNAIQSKPNEEPTQPLDNKLLRKILSENIEIKTRCEQLLTDKSELLITINKKQKEVKKYLQEIKNLSEELKAVKTKKMDTMLLELKSRENDIQKEKMFEKDKEKWALVKEHLLRAELRATANKQKNENHSTTASVGSGSPSPPPPFQQNGSVNININNQNQVEICKRLEMAQLALDNALLTNQNYEMQLKILSHKIKDYEDTAGDDTDDEECEEYGDDTRNLQYFLKRATERYTELEGKFDKELSHRDKILKNLLHKLKDEKDETSKYVNLYKESKEELESTTLSLVNLMEVSGQLESNCEELRSKYEKSHSQITLRNEIICKLKTELENSENLIANIITSATSQIYRNSQIMDSSSGSAAGSAKNSAKAQAPAESVGEIGIKKIFPVTIKQITSTNAYDICIGESFRFISIMVAAIVRSIEVIEKDKKYLFIVDDQTESLEAKYSVPKGEPIPTFQVGSYVKIVGAVQQLSTLKKAIVVCKVFPIVDLNELTAHLLEVGLAAKKLHKIKLENKRKEILGQFGNTYRKPL